MKLVLASLLLLVGCTARSAPDAGPSDARVIDTPGAACPACEGATEVACDGTRRSCEALCVPGIGCQACIADRRFCRSSSEVFTCSADGAGGTPTELCSPGSVCASGRCIRPCEHADGEEEPSTGCEFVAVPTLNSSLGAGWRRFMDFATLGADGFHYAVAVANPQSYALSVRITGPDVDRTFELGPGAIRTEILPWIPTVSQVYPAGVATGGSAIAPFRGDPSVLARGASYRIESNAPLVAYQFNPLNYYDDDPRHRTCEGGETFECHSFTNDASLLLPVRGLGRHYTVVSVGSPFATEACGPDFGVVDGPSGYFAVVGTSEEPTEVVVTPRTPLRAGLDHGRLPAGAPARFILERGDVLQLVADRPTEAECDPVESQACAQPCRMRGDLTGTRVDADRPVAVFSGHACATVPAGELACDHLEDQLWPDEALGRRYTILPLYASQAGRRILTVARVVATRDGTHVALRPAATGVDGATLDAGEHLELEILGPVALEADAPVAVAEFLVGQALTAPLSSDPSMVVAVPEEQWRTDYPISIPSSYEESWLTIAWPVGAAVTVDDAATVPYERFGGFDVAYLRVEPGAHWVRGTAPFTVLVSGHGPFVSYAYPGGGNLTTLE